MTFIVLQAYTLLRFEHSKNHGSSHWIILSGVFYFPVFPWSQGAQGQLDQLQQRRQHGGRGLRRRRLILAESQPPVVSHVQQPESVSPPGESHAQSSAPQHR